MATINVGVSLPKELVVEAKTRAEKEGVSFSVIVCKGLNQYLGTNVPVPVWGRKVGLGGDMSKYKTAETHARVCERMREAKEAKRSGIALSKTEEERIKRLAIAEAEKIILERKREELTDEKKSKIYWEVRKEAEARKQAGAKNTHDGRAHLSA